MRYLSLFLFFSIALKTSILQGQINQNTLYLNNEIKFERLAIENGLSNNIAFGMTQDRKGFMWFATLDALIKYDGYTLTRYQNDPQDANSLGDNIVMSVFEDHTGLIWVGTAGGGGVNSFDPETAKWKRYPHDPKNANSMGKGSIEGIAEDRSGMLWFGSTDGLTRYNPKTKRFTLFINNPNNKYSLSDNRVYSIVEDNNGMLWIGTESGVNLFDPKDERFYLIDGDFKNRLKLENSIIHHIFKDKSGLLWLSSYDNGVFVINPASKKCIAHYSHNPNDPRSIGSNVVSAITEDLNGSYWISTQEGLFHFNPKTKIFTLNENKRYLPNTVTKGHCILTDKAGLVWIGTTGRGVIYFAPQHRKFKRYLNDETSLKFGNGSNRVKSIFKSNDSQLYVATSQNLLRFNPTKDDFEEVWQLKSIRRKTEYFVITTACEKEPGVYWLGTDKVGIIQYDSNKRKVTFLINNTLDKESLASNWVNQLYKDRSGKIWVGTEGGFLQWYNETTKKFISFKYNTLKEDVPPNTGIQFIYEDSKGDLWLGIKAFHMALGGNGVYRINLKKEQIKHYKQQQGILGTLSSNSVTCMYEDQKGIFWIGTYGGGLNKLELQTEKFTVFTKENGLLSNTVQALSGDKSGNLWIMANEGITRFNGTTFKTKQFGSSVGLSTSPLGVELDDYNAYLSLKNAEGDIFFSSNNGNNGLIVFNPSSIQENNFQPPLVITNFKIFDKTYPLIGKEISLDYNQNFFDIEFAALSYLSSGANQYMYKLEGINDDWVNNGSSRIAHFTNVPYGKYIFRVKGSNNDGVWNEKGISFTIIIHPPWWLTWWAYILYLLLIIASIWAIIYYRSINLVRQKRLLEKQVVDRTAEVVLQKEELQTALGDLKATQAQLIQSEKMASLGELTAGIAHEIQNPLNFVNNFSEVSEELIEELKSPLTPDGGIREGEKVDMELFDDVVQNLRKISLHGKRASSIVKGMLEHSRTSSGKKELTDINALTDEYLKLAYHGLRAKDKDFQADYKTEFDTNLPKIEVIPQDIGRVLLNLINNAFQAVDEASKGSVSQDYKPTVKISTRYLAPSLPERAGGEIELRVKDNGPGIPDKIKDKIFQPFFTTKETGKGTGLGLSLAYNIVKAHGGTIEIKSSVGVGTELFVNLPI